MKYILTLLILNIVLISNAQDAAFNNDTKMTPISVEPTKILADGSNAVHIVDDTKIFGHRVTARRQIRDLSNGVIFLRLKTNENKIQKLKEHNMPKRAATAQKEIDDLNGQILAAYKSSFQFCPVYVFYSNHTDQIKEGNYENLLDLDGNKVEEQNFGTIFYSEYSKIVMDTEFNKRYDSIVLMDENFKQLNTPFPFSKMYNMFRTSKYKKNGVFLERVIIGLNKDLFAFYKYAQRKG